MQHGMLAEFSLSSFLTPSKLFKIFPKVLEQTTILKYRNNICSVLFSYNEYHLQA